MRKAKSNSAFSFRGFRAASASRPPRRTTLAALARSAREEIPHMRGGGAAQLLQSFSFAGALRRADERGDVNGGRMPRSSQRLLAGGGTLALRQPLRQVHDSR